MPKKKKNCLEACSWVPSPSRLFFHILLYPELTSLAGLAPDSIQGPAQIPSHSPEFPFYKPPLLK